MITVFSTCPYCKIIQESCGERLEAVALKTKEAWVIECNNCNRVFVWGESIKETI